MALLAHGHAPPSSLANPPLLLPLLSLQPLCPVPPPFQMDCLFTLDIVLNFVTVYEGDGFLIKVDPSPPPRCEAAL